MLSESQDDCSDIIGLQVNNKCKFKDKSYLRMFNFPNVTPGYEMDV